MDKELPSGERFAIRQVVDSEIPDNQLAWIVRGMREELNFQIIAAKENNETKKV